MLQTYSSRPIEFTLPFQKMSMMMAIFWLLAILLLPNVTLAQRGFAGMLSQPGNFGSTDFTDGYKVFRFKPHGQHYQIIPRGNKCWNDPRPYDAEEFTQAPLDSEKYSHDMFEVGRWLHEDGYNKSLGAKFIENSARCGNTQAASYLGRIYLEGSGRPRDAVRALEWFTEADLLNVPADRISISGWNRGLPSTLAALEHLYGVELHDWYGDNQPLDHVPHPYREEISDDDILAKIRIADIFFRTAEAIEDKKRSNKLYGDAYDLYRGAADEGSLEAMTKAGKLLMEGRGIKKDDNEALKLWRQAGRAGYAPAIFEYGLALRDGTGVGADPVGAYDHLLSAQDRGMSRAAEAADNLVVKHCLEKKTELCQPVPLLYATTRGIAKNNDSDNSASFGGGPGNDMHFGETWRPILSYPEELPTGNWFHRKVQKIKNWWRKLHEVKLRYTGSLSEEEFFKEIADSNGIMLFIHGYNNSFDDAARAVAPFVYRAKLDFLPVIYSWPSLGATPGYLHDLDRQRADCGNLVDFLSKIAEARKGRSDVRIVAHSMGSEILFSALTSCAYTGKRYSTAIDSEKKSFGKIAEVVLAAPDISVANFRTSLQTFVNKANRVTIYRSARDMVLVLSELIRVRQPRLGQGGNSSVVQHDKVQTIEVLDTGESGGMRHAYVFQDHRVIHDIKETFRPEHDDSQRAVSPDCRIWPLRVNTGPLYWKIEGNPRPPAGNGHCSAQALDVQ